jgi:hypothetical protein
MIAQTLATLTNEITGLWSGVIGIVAGWGLTFTLVVAAIIYAHIRINRLTRRLENVSNNQVTENRDLSIRLRNLEK